MNSETCQGCVSKSKADSNLILTQIPVEEFERDEFDKRKYNGTIEQDETVDFTYNPIQEQNDIDYQFIQIGDLRAEIVHPEVNCMAWFFNFFTKE